MHSSLRMALAIGLLSCASRDDGAVHENALEDEGAAAADEGVVADEAAPAEHGVGVGGWAGDPDDMDRDGVPADVDLDDHEELVGRTLPEVECNGFDEDGDGLDSCPVDHDGDGVRAALDCDDLDGLVSPNAQEIWCNGVDENCNGVDDCDRDADGIRDTDDAEPDLPAVAGSDGDPRRWP